MQRSLKRAIAEGIRSARGEFDKDRDDGRFKLSGIERRRLERAPRFFHTSSPLLGRRISLTDPYWYLYCYDEIFVNQIYKFDAATPSPLIIDCGANIGLSILYFKYLFPDSTIVAFEPDEEIFRVLMSNVRTFELSNVTLHQRAVWTADTEMLFQPDGTIGGRLVGSKEAQNPVRVSTVRLRDLLNRPIDFLKLDIEGAEFAVIQDCQEALDGVANLFVEYHGKSHEGQVLDEMLGIMRRAGFRYYLKESLPVKHPFLLGERGGLYDLVVNVFGIRA